MSPGAVPRVLRDYQGRAQGQLAAFLQGPPGQAAYLGFATGMGKTYTVADYIGKHLNHDLQTVIWLTHRQELIAQCAKDLRQYLPEHVPLGFEQGVRRTAGPGQVTICSIPSVMGRLDRVRDLAEGKTLVVFDEAHHREARTWQAIKGALSERAYFLNLTATPYTVSVANPVKDLGMCLGYYSTRDAIDAGYLTPLVNIDWPMSSLRGDIWTPDGEMQAQYKQSLLCTPEAIAAVTQQLAPHLADNISLIFAASVAHGELISARLKEQHQLDIPLVHAATPKPLRESLVGKLRAGQIAGLINYNVFTEGTDIPAVNRIFSLRPTKYAHTDVQIKGRGLRPLLDGTGQLVSLSGLPVSLGSALAKPFCQSFSLLPPVEVEKKHCYLPLPDQFQTERVSARIGEHGAIQAGSAIKSDRTFACCFYPAAAVAAWYAPNSSGIPQATEHGELLLSPLSTAQAASEYWPHHLATANGQPTIEALIEAVERRGFEYLPRDLPADLPTLEAWRKTKQVGYAQAQEMHREFTELLGLSVSRLSRNLLSNAHSYPQREVTLPDGIGVLVKVGDTEFLANGPTTPIQLLMKGKWYRTDIAESATLYPVEQVRLGHHQVTPWLRPDSLWERMGGLLPADSCVLRLAHQVRKPQDAVRLGLALEKQRSLLHGVER